MGHWLAVGGHIVVHEALPHTEHAFLQLHIVSIGTNTVPGRNLTFGGLARSIDTKTKAPFQWVISPVA